MSKNARLELIKVVADRYGAADRAEKSRILDEFSTLTGYHRKHAIRVLNGAPPSGRTRASRPGRRVYDEAVKQALIVLWEASDRICGKRLKALIPTLVEALERHGHLSLDEAVRAKLLRVSASTIDRLLRPVRAGSKKRRRRPPSVRAHVPIRTFSEWDDPAPGFMEVDLVAHCGGSMAGSVSHTMTLTDIASGWTECVALPVRDSGLVVEGLRRMAKTMPFPLRGVDTDNGSEFVNAAVLAFCQSHDVEFTRSRPYRKNDQAWVEQKNSSGVRRLVGHGRLEGIAGAEALARLYASSRLFVNFFQPSFKLLSKTRVGGRVRKKYARPETPAARLLVSDRVNEEMKQRLRAVMVTLDPLKLLDEIHLVQQHIAALASGAPSSLPVRSSDLDQFLRSLGAAWRAGEVRPTHQPTPKRARHWRTREDPFALVWPEVVGWLEAEPDRTAKELMARLMGAHPGKYQDGQLRTLQRCVKTWRRLAAQRLIFSGSHGSWGTDVADPADATSPLSGVNSGEAIR